MYVGKRNEFEMKYKHVFGKETQLLRSAHNIFFSYGYHCNQVCYSNENEPVNSYIKHLTCRSKITLLLIEHTF